MGTAGRDTRQRRGPASGRGASERRGGATADAPESARAGGAAGLYPGDLIKMLCKSAMEVPLRMINDAW